MDNSIHNKVQRSLSEVLKIWYRPCLNHRLSTILDTECQIISNISIKLCNNQAVIANPLRLHNKSIKYQWCRNSKCNLSVETTQCLAIIRYINHKFSLSHSHWHSNRIFINHLFLKHSILLKVSKFNHKSSRISLRVLSKWMVYSINNNKELYSNKFRQTISILTFRLSQSVIHLCSQARSRMIRCSISNRLKTTTNSSNQTMLVL